MDRLLDLTGRVALVTGGGTGIGAATARLLAEHGADVAIAGRTPATLEPTATAVAAATGRRCLPVRADVTAADQVAGLVDRVVADLGRIDVLVNGVGGSHRAQVADLAPEAWDATFDANVRSAYLCTREVGRHLVAQRSGAVVSVSSAAGVGGMRGGAHYSAAKAALQMFTTVTAAEWGPFGVRANCVAVGPVDNENAVARREAAGLDASAYTRMTALQRFGTVEEVAAAILFLASAAGGYVTGQTLAVDGGAHIAGL